MSAARLARSVTVAVALALALGACAANGSSSSSSSSSGVNLPKVTQLPVPTDAARAADTGKATCPQGTEIAYAGAQTGANAQLGINILDGVKTAVQEHNKANPNCQVTLKTFDTVGDPTRHAQPTRAAQRLKFDQQGARPLHAGNDHRAARLLWTFCQQEF